VVVVPLATLDDYAQKTALGNVDFVKIDAEGAEASILRGAQGMLWRRPRPVILCEMYDVRTAPWGHGVRLVHDLLVDCDYKWFSLRPDSALQTFSPCEGFDANLLAVPVERLPRLIDRLASSAGSGAR
jgi:hypothetical protein